MVTRAEAIDCARAVLRGQPDVGYVESAKRLAQWVIEETTPRPSPFANVPPEESTDANR